MSESLSYRRALTLEEVPLPPGYSRALLAPAAKAEQLRKYLARKREVKENIARLLEACKEDGMRRQLVYEKCKRSPVYFIDHFCMTFDDRADEGVVPMVSWQVQIDKIAEPYIRLCETKAPHRITQATAKSRAMGFTWYSLALRLWRWTFHNNWSILIGGENRDDVDDGGQGATQQSLFGKLRFMLNNLPGWMKTDLYGPLIEKEEYNKRGFLKHPLKPRNVIHGKQLGSMFGRSRRYSEVWGDEVGHAEEMEDADKSLKQTTNRASFGSTPKGKSGFFYQIMHSSLAVQRYYLWWAEAPALTLDWYNEQRQHMTDESIAQELDISFEMSAGGRVLSEVVLEKWFIPQAVWTPNLELQVVIDPGYADHFAAIWTQWDPVNEQGRVVDSVMTNRKTVDWIVPFVLGIIPQTTHRGEPWPHEYTSVEKEIIVRHGTWGAPHYVGGDKAGGARSLTSGTSAWEELERYGIFVDEIRIQDDEEAIKVLGLFMRHIRFADYLLEQRNGPRETCATMGEVVTQWRYPKIRDNSTSRVSKPIHDMYCHLGDCLKMWASTLYLPDAVVQPVEAGPVLRQRLSESRVDPILAKGVWR